MCFTHGREPCDIDKGFSASQERIAGGSMNGTAIVACIATGAAGIVFGAVIGATGFSVLSAASRDSERVKSASIANELEQTKKRFYSANNESYKQGEILRVIKAKHPDVLSEAELEVSAPSF